MHARLRDSMSVGLDHKRCERSFEEAHLLTAEICSAQLQPLLQGSKSYQRSFGVQVRLGLLSCSRASRAPCSVPVGRLKSPSFPVNRLLQRHWPGTAAVRARSKAPSVHRQKLPHSELQAQKFKIREASAALAGPTHRTSGSDRSSREL